MPEGVQRKVYLNKRNRKAYQRAAAWPRSTWVEEVARSYMKDKTFHEQVIDYVRSRPRYYIKDEGLSASTVYIGECLDQELKLLALNCSESSGLEIKVSDLLTVCVQMRLIGDALENTRSAASALRRLGFNPEKKVIDLGMISK